jgi:hypothetical protein
MTDYIAPFFRYVNATAPATRKQTAMIIPIAMMNGIAGIGGVARLFCLSGETFARGMHLAFESRAGSA